MEMTLNIVDTAYSKKFDRLKKKSKKYKQRSKNLTNVVTEYKSRITNMEANTDEIVQNFEQTQSKLMRTNESLNRTIITQGMNTPSYTNNKAIEPNHIEFKFTIVIMLWMFMFVSIIRMVHTNNGLSNDDMEVIYGSMTIATIGVICGCFAVSRL
jgi:uncharacterized protein YukE